MSKKKYLFLGDVHGSPIWQEWTSNPNEYEHIVFVGDYVDSFHVKSNDIISNLEDIISFKKSLPNKVTLILGNHDLQYMFLGEVETMPGFDAEIAETLSKLFVDNKSLFNAAFGISTDDIDYLCTHAGLTHQFYEQAKPYITSNKLEDIVTGLNMVCYSFPMLFTANYSPVWARPDMLFDNNTLINFNKLVTQIVGHTHKINGKYLTEVKTYQDRLGSKLNIIDCLQYEPFILSV